MFLLIALLVLISSASSLLYMVWRQARKLIHPKRRPLTQSPADVGIGYWEEVEFQTLDGITLRGWFIPAKGAWDGSTIIGIHGLGATACAFWNRLCCCASKANDMLGLPNRLRASLGLSHVLLNGRSSALEVLSKLGKALESSRALQKRWSQ